MTQDKAKPATVSSQINLASRSASLVCDDIRGCYALATPLEVLTLCGLDEQAVELQNDLANFHNAIGDTAASKPELDMPAANAHIDYASEAEAAELDNAWKVAGRLWSRAAQACQDIKQSSEYISRSNTCEFNARQGKREPQTTPGTSDQCRCTGPVEENTGRCRICQKPKRAV